MKKSDAETFAIGVAAYYGMLYGLIFYPAVVIGADVGYRAHRWWGEDYWDAIPHWMMAGFFSGGIVIFSILYAFHRWKWYGSRKCIKFLLILYGITLWPFISYCQWIWGPYAKSAYELPWQGMDWIPFF